MPGEMTHNLQRFLEESDKRNGLEMLRQAKTSDHKAHLAQTEKWYLDNSAVIDQEVNMIVGLQDCEITVSREVENLRLYSYRQPAARNCRLWVATSDNRIRCCRLLYEMKPCVRSKIYEARKL